MISFFEWFKKESKAIKTNKFLIVGLGNIGVDYKKTRHNIGFRIIDFFALENNIKLEESKLGQIGTLKYGGKKIILLKPSTLMNLSGKSVRYWANKEKIAIQNILVLTDDLNLDFNVIKLKGKGSDGGHNGLKNIEYCLNTTNYARLRFGIGIKESIHKKIDFVLGHFSLQEEKKISHSLKICKEIIFSYIKNGLENTMNLYNGK